MNNSKLELWKERIQECKSSGLTVPQWCHNNNLSKNQYYYWHKIIQLDYERSEAPMFAEVFVETTTPSYEGAIKLSCKNVEMTLSSKKDISLVVEFIYELQKRC